MFTCFECLCCRCTKPLQCLDTKIAECGFGFLKSKFFYLEVLVIEAIKQEVQKIRNNSFGTFTFQKFYKIVVCRRKEFDKNFSNNTDTRFLNI